MRVVFMGTPDFSVGTLRELAKAGHEIVGVISQPDKPKGRGKNLQPTPVKEAAMELGLPVYQPKKVRDPEFIQVMKELNPDVIVVVAFGQIIPKEILHMPKYGCINVHASLLPAYRGAAPIQWAVINGDKESGVTIMRICIFNTSSFVSSDSVQESRSVISAPNIRGDRKIHHNDIIVFCSSCDKRHMRSPTPCSQPMIEICPNGSISQSG